MEAIRLVYLLIVCFLGCVAARRTGTQFPTCKNATEKCTAGCEEVRISIPHTTEYSSNNTLCIDSNLSSASYRLEGCPDVFYNTYQGTGGVCVITDDSGTDVLLTGNELPEGLHEFICFVNSSHSINSSAIVANDDSPYRDVLVYNNGVLQSRYDATNVTVNASVGDNISVVTRTFGNVSFLNASDGRDRFRCLTGFSCDQHTRNSIDNRYLQCALSSPAEPSDDGRVLTILVDDTEQIAITITLIALPDHSTTPTASIEPTASTEPTTTPSMTTTGSISNASTIDQTPSPTGHSVPTNSSSNGGVSGGVIAAVVIAVVIAVALAATACVIYYCKYKESHVHRKGPQDTAKRVEEASTVLNSYNATPQQVILNSTCSHCDRLDPQIKAKGHVMKKLSKEQLTNDHITLLNGGALLILCSCMECTIPNQLRERSSVSKDWLAVQLHQGDPGNNPLQSSGKLKTVTFNDLDNDGAVDEVLHWLETESHRRLNTTTSSNEQHQNTSDSTIELLDQHTEMLEEIRTGIGALQKDNVKNSLKRQISAE